MANILKLETDLDSESEMLSKHRTRLLGVSIIQEKNADTKCSYTGEKCGHCFYIIRRKMRFSDISCFIILSDPSINTLLSYETERMSSMTNT